MSSDTDIDTNTDNNTCSNTNSYSNTDTITGTDKWQWQYTIYDTKGRTDTDT